MPLYNTVINSFFLRNVSLLGIILSPVIMQAVTIGTINDADVAYQAATVILLYLVILFHNMFLYERFFLRRMYFPYAIATAFTVYLMHKLFIALSAMIYIVIPEYTTVKWFSIFWADLVYIYAGLAVYMTYKHLKENETMNKIQLIGKDLELKQLKAQLQPHFLFNALNNIYSYGLRGNSKSNELILKLSEQMRYIMNHSAIERIAVAEEVVFIGNYIDFEREQLGRRCEIVFVKSILDETRQIPPLIFFPYIENAFKHGTNTIGISSIFISFDVLPDKIQFKSKNSIFKGEQKVSTNVGMANAARRLQLLYPDAHSLKITEEDGFFIVEIVLYA